MPATKPHRVTLADIASRAGVSRQVVSAVLGISTGNVRYSPDTHDRVMAIVRETRFRPNRTAKNLVKKRHGAIGVLVTNFGHVPDQVLRTMLHEAHGRGQVIIMDAVSPEDTQPPLFLREDSVDGLVVFEDIDAATMKEIARLDIPCVRVNTNVRNLPGCITYNELGAMAMAVEHLHEHGRNTLAVLAGPSGHYSMRLRVKGVEKACARLGLSAPQVHTFQAKGHMGTGDEAALQELTSFLEGHPDVDAMVLTVDGMAPLFYRACTLLGKRIPDDIAVVGVNNSGIALGVSPALTSLFVHPRQVGRQAVELLSNLMDTGTDNHRPIKLTYQMQERDSTAVG